MLLESRGDIEFAHKLTHGLKTLTEAVESLNESIKQGNDRYGQLYKLVREIASEEIPADVSDEMNNVYGRAQDLMEALEMAGLGKETKNAFN